MQREELLKKIQEAEAQCELKHSKLSYIFKSFYPKVFLELCKLTDNVCTSSNPTIYERLYVFKENITNKNELLCPICKKNYRKFGFKNYFVTCSDTCRNKNPKKIDKQKQTRIRHFGKYVSDEIIEKKRKTCLEKYGVSSYSKLKEFSDKVKATKLKNHGSETYNNSEKMLQTKECRYGSKSYCNLVKRQETLKKKYGVIAPVQISSVQKKQQETCLKRYGVKCYVSSKECCKQSKKMSYEKMLNNKFDVPVFSFDDYLKTKGVNEFQFKCRKCNRIFSAIHRSGLHNKCPFCYPYVPSKSQFELTSFLKQFALIFENSRKVIPPYELDAYIPEKKLAFEFDGLFWHSNEVLTNENYHLNKTILCENLGIQLVHIFENEWLQKKEIVKGIIKNLLGIYDYEIKADSCIIKNIDYKTSLEFQNKNCILENKEESNSMVNLGLFFNNELLYLMSFFYEKETNVWKLISYCNKIGYNIQDGAKKLLYYFNEMYHPKTIISLVDRRWSNGKLQENLGFKLINVLNPEKHFWTGTVAKSGFKFETQVNQQKIKNNKYHVIFDCGKLMYLKEL